MQVPIVAWVVFIAAAVLEVAGDAVIRKGLRGAGIGIVLVGCVILGLYGVVVNLVSWDFSKLLGVYVAVFAIVSVFCGLLIFDEAVPASTWAGLLMIVAGGLVIQFGSAGGR